MELPSVPNCPGPYALNETEFLKRPDVDDTFIINFPHLAHIYNEIKGYNLPNYRGAKIPLPTLFNIELWDEMLGDYYDTQLTDFLRFSWPCGYDSNRIPKLFLTNHASGKREGEQVNKSFKKNLNIRLY